MVYYFSFITLIILLSLAFSFWRLKRHFASLWIRELVFSFFDVTNRLSNKLGHVGFKIELSKLKSNLKWTLKRLSRDPNLHMALLTAAALRKKTALSLQDRKNPLLKLLPFVSKVKRKAEFSIFFFTFRHVQHSLQRGHIALFFPHKCPTESRGGQ